MAVFVDPDISAAQMQRREEDAIGYAVAFELRLRREWALLRDTDAEADKLRPEAESK
jgi:hypothetical protein